MNSKLQIRKATRRQVKLKIGLAGPAGSGKTMSALRMAYGMTGDWNKIGVIDTENRSSELYSDLGEFQVISLEAPFSPEVYSEAIELFASDPDVEVVIIDSMSHEWEGRGGILEIADSMTGNNFTKWGKLTPRHNRFIDAILYLNKHTICTLRTKQDYVMQERNGKQVPEKVGLKAITREGVDYEFSLVFDIDIKHNATASKDRTKLFTDKPEVLLSEGHGKRLIEWANTGETEDNRPALNPVQLNKVLDRIKNGEVDLKEKCQKEFKLSPEQLVLISQCGPFNETIKDENPALMEDKPQAPARIEVQGKPTITPGQLTKAVERIQKNGDVFLKERIREEYSLTPEQEKTIMEA